MTTDLPALARMAYASYRMVWDTHGGMECVPTWEELELESRTAWMAAIATVVGALNIETTEEETDG